MQLTSAQISILERIKRGELSGSSLEPMSIADTEHLLEIKLASGTKTDDGYSNLRLTTDGETYLALLQSSLELPWYIRNRVALIIIMVAVPIATIAMNIVMGKFRF